MNGELHMGNLQESNSGLYSCRAETSAGISTSKEAKLNVQRMFERNGNNTFAILSNLFLLLSSKYNTIYVFKGV